MDASHSKSRVSRKVSLFGAVLSVVVMREREIEDWRRQMSGMSLVLADQSCGARLFQGGAYRKQGVRSAPIHNIFDAIARSQPLRAAAGADVAAKIDEIGEMLAEFRFDRALERMCRGFVIHGEKDLT